MEGGGKLLGYKSNLNRSDSVAWNCEEPLQSYEKLKDQMAFYPGKVDCYLEGEKVAPQPGGFYGGWMTTKICGPVKVTQVLNGGKTHNG